MHLAGHLLLGRRCGLILLVPRRKQLGRQYVARCLSGIRARPVGGFFKLVQEHASRQLNGFDALKAGRFAEALLLLGRELDREDHAGL